MPNIFQINPYISMVCIRFAVLSVYGCYTNTYKEKKYEEVDMIFLFTMAYSVALVALSFGIVFLVWGYRHEGPAVMLARVFGYIITILAGLMLLSMSYVGVSNWSQGYFSVHGASAQVIGYGGGMQCPMMQNMQKMKTMQGEKKHQM
jgi:hypothetical protein